MYGYIAFIRCFLGWQKGQIEKELYARVYGDAMGISVLISQATISTHKACLITKPRTLGDYYIFLRYDNVVNDRLYIPGGYHNMSEYSIMFDGKGKVYDNGGSEIWK